MGAKFKIGDKVYCPSLSTEILTIHPLPTEVEWRCEAQDTLMLKPQMLRLPYLTNTANHFT